METAYTLFISDLHLQPNRQDICEAFIKFSHSDIARAADAIYILGDFLDYWVGDDTPTAGIDHALDALSYLTQTGIQVYFQHGNRDFLIGNHFANRYGITLLPETQIIELYNQPTLLLHGDTLCTDDIEYQHFRKTVRDQTWQQQFLNAPLEQRLQMAAEARSISQQSTQSKQIEIMDVNPDAVLTALAEHQVTHMIHGHTHRPAQHTLQQSPKPLFRTVLSDWDQHGSYLYASTEEQSLHYFPLTTEAF